MFLQLKEQLSSLDELLIVLTSGQYNKKIVNLGNASIGSHTRHIIELLNCLTSGYEAGVIDYLSRVRNLRIETDKIFAISELNKIPSLILQPDKELKMIIETDEAICLNDVTTTFYREIVYHTEHVIHHLALIRVALRAMKLNIVTDNFGMAYSTMKYLYGQNKTIGQTA